MENLYSIKDHILRQEHVAFFVADLAEAVAFYTEVFGFEVLYYGRVDVVNETLVYLKRDGFMLELLHIPSLSRQEIYENAMKTQQHFAFIVDNIVFCRQRLEKHPGIRFEEPEIRNVPGINNRDLLVAFFRGINGERVELMEVVTK